MRRTTNIQSEIRSKEHRTFVRVIFFRIAIFWPTTVNWNRNSDSVGASAHTYLLATLLATFNLNDECCIRAGCWIKWNEEKPHTQMGTTTERIHWNGHFNITPLVHTRRRRRRRRQAAIILIWFISSADVGTPYTLATVATADLIHAHTQARARECRVRCEWLCQQTSRTIQLGIRVVARWTRIHTHTLALALALARVCLFVPLCLYGVYIFSVHRDTSQQLPTWFYSLSSLWSFDMFMNRVWALQKDTFESVHR